MIVIINALFQHKAQISWFLARYINIYLFCLGKLRQATLSDSVPDIYLTVTRLPCLLIHCWIF